MKASLVQLFKMCLAFCSIKQYLQPMGSQICPWGIFNFGIYRCKEYKIQMYMGLQVAKVFLPTKFMKVF